MSNQIEGVIHVIIPTKNYSENFRKASIVIKKPAYGDKEHFIILDFTQKNADLIEAFIQGDRVNIHFNITGREWIAPDQEVKYFNSLEGWKIDKLTTEQPKEPEVEELADSDDLPF